MYLPNARKETQKQKTLYASSMKALVRSTIPCPSTKPVSSLPPKIPSHINHHFPPKPLSLTLNTLNTSTSTRLQLRPLPPLFHKFVVTVKLLLCTNNTGPSPP